MIDLVVKDERKSRGEELSTKYQQFPVRESKTDIYTVQALRDISLTLGIILDEMRGIKHDS